ncbi:MAG TPA: patatin-like phospholipase family protein [Rubrivivax sp.]|nr:patatin-like phospholipase family protein [Rubrivivax sp.]
MAERTAFVFTGGGSLGAIQVGMLQELLEAGLQPDFVVGASVGAINAAYFAGAPDLDGVARLAELWVGLRRRDVFPLTLSSALRLLWHAESLVSPGPLRRLLEARLGLAKLEDARIALHVIATDAQGVGVRLCSGPAVDAILASAAIPAVFPPVTINGRALMDGAIAANTPLRLAAGLGATRIVVLPTGYACALQGPPQGVVAKALHAITLLIAWQLMHELEAMPPAVQVHVAPTLCPLEVSPYDFSASRRLIERARRSTRDWIGGGGLERRAQARELEAHHH